MKRAKLYCEGSLHDETGKTSRGSMAFPFMKLPLELRIMIYKLRLNYDRIHALIDYASNRQILYRTSASNMRKFALYCGYGSRNPVYAYFPSASLLRVNRAIYAEALPELRKAPLVIDPAMIDVFDRFHTTIAHYVPFASLKNIKHIHFDMFTRPAGAVQRLLWDGAPLTADINEDERRQNVTFPGILKAENLLPPKPKRKKGDQRRPRHPDTHPEGKYALETISFEGTLDKPMMLNLADTVVKSKVIDHLMSGSFDDDTLRALILEHGHECKSYSPAYPESTYVEDET